jgi:hypothetical protein
MNQNEGSEKGTLTASVLAIYKWRSWQKCLCVPKNSMQQCLSWESNSRSHIQPNLHILWSTKDYYPDNPNLSQITVIHMATPYFNTILPSQFLPTCFLTEFFYAFLVDPTSAVSAFSFNGFIAPVIVQFGKNCQFWSCMLCTFLYLPITLLSLRSKYSSQHPVLKHSIYNFPLGMTHQAVLPYSAAIKITASYRRMSFFMFQIGNPGDKWFWTEW